MRPTSAARCRRSPRASTWCTPRVGTVVGCARLGWAGPSSLVWHHPIVPSNVGPSACGFVPAHPAWPAALAPDMPCAGGRLEAVSSSARWEDVVGYSRAVKRGPFIYVSGAPTGCEGWSAGGPSRPAWDALRYAIRSRQPSELLHFPATRQPSFSHRHLCCGPGERARDVPARCIQAGGSSTALAASASLVTCPCSRCLIGCDPARPLLPPRCRRAWPSPSSSVRWSRWAKPAVLRAARRHCRTHTAHTLVVAGLSELRRTMPAAPCRWGPP